MLQLKNKENTGKRRCTVYNDHQNAKVNER